MTSATAPPRRVVAVDWSGRVSPTERHHLWLAEVVDGRITRLEDGRTRAELVDDLNADPPDLVGLDLSFSLPAWWLDRHGLADGPALWDRATVDGEGWLASCEHPFWGRRPQLPRPAMPDEWRATERALRDVGLRPRSTFQVGGAGAVGTGSVRGWPHLAVLRRAGFAIWPFDEPAPGQPTVVEIYPRQATGPVVKSSAAARAAAVGGLGLPPAAAAAARGSEDAFDAAASALALASAVPGSATTPGGTLTPPFGEAPAIAAREGWILPLDPATLSLSPHSAASATLRG